MKIFKKMNNTRFFTIAFIALVSFVFIYFSCVKLFEKISYDTMVKLSATQKGSAGIINIVIDDASIEEISPLPWKRTLYTDIFDFLKVSQAKAIVFDALLANAGDVLDDKEFLERIKDNDNLIVGVNFTKNINTQNNEQELNIFEQKFALNVVDKRKIPFKKQTNYLAYQEIFPEYMNTVNYIGAVNSAIDTDGTIRAFEPIIFMNGKFYPSLPLATILFTNNYKEIILYDNSYEIHYMNGNFSSYPITIKNDKFVQYIKWLKPYDNTSWVPYEQIKASDVITSFRQIQLGEPPKVDYSKFKDKIVIIGATANALYDLKITPMSINFPGLAIQATAIDNLISNNTFTILSHFTNILIILFFVLIIGFVIFFFSPIISLISSLIIAFLYFYMALLLFYQGLVINVITPYIFFVVSAILAYSYKFSIENYKKERLKRAMKKYINTNIVDDIMKNTDEEVKLGGKKSELTILMADIRGFTRISEKLEPEEVTNLLNEYFGIMIPIIEKYNGAINKFIGDAILAVFNEPIKDKKHPQNAIYCANEMLQALRELKKKWKQENKPDIGISIGINTGIAFIGNIGTHNHLEYTVIGDTVNVASRIEAQNRKFNTQILISEATYEYVKDFVDVIKISSVEIRGREKHMDIYEIINVIE